MYSTPAMTLRRYDSSEVGPAVLIIPAPIKRAYIWDLSPEVSAVQRFVGGGFRVFLVDWERPKQSQRDLRLEDYAHTFMLDGLRAIQRETGEAAAFLAGHSLGGTFAAIFAAICPDLIRGLALFSSPVAFGPESSDFFPLVQASPPAGQVISQFGNVPGSFLDASSLAAAPDVFWWQRLTDWYASCADADRLRTHLLVHRWSLDESPMAGRLFEEVVEQLYREDRFMRGTLQMGNRLVAARQVSSPILSVTERKSSVVAPQAVLPFYETASGSDKSVLWYEGEVGVALQHVGPLVGAEAHRRIWPEVIKWLRNHSGG